ncbi:hypothetical protein GN958_ATG19734 [Phytophthora infestans]|uniref:Uncharacterized protein n=1 Tax=Phytophthora infestans TaxID=4787 RepID=A0A8S9TWB1_PHYIN|nr:hypothetical protein GN958_ATG19734 [Phytophthora infestans]
MSAIYKPWVCSICTCSEEEKVAQAESEGSADALFRISDQVAGYRLLEVLSGKLIKRRDISFREDINEESSYLEELLVKQYECCRVQIPVNASLVDIPVDGVRDHELIPSSDDHNEFD